MNRAIWTKAVGDAKGLWLGCALILFSFHWLFVWLTSVINLPKIPSYVADLLPAPMQGLIPIPLELLAAPGGMLALAYVDPVVLFTASIWAIARGSDSVSGPLDRGTLEMVLAQPVRRTVVLLAHACVTTAGALLLVVVGWLGICAGLAVIDFDPPVDPYRFLPAAVNLFTFTFFLAGFSTAVSASHRYRWQTIGWVGGVYIFQLILKVLAPHGSAQTRLADVLHLLRAVRTGQPGHRYRWRRPDALAAIQRRSRRPGPRLLSDCGLHLRPPRPARAPVARL